MLYGRIRQKGSVYKSYVRSAILYGSEAWCLKESEMEIKREELGQEDLWREECVEYSSRTEKDLWI